MSGSPEMHLPPLVQGAAASARTFIIAGKCRECGCTDERACLDEETGLPCHWTDESESLCNVCALRIAAEWLEGALCRRVVLGAQQRVCADCGQSIWVSVASLATVIDTGKPYELCCLACTSKRISSSPSVEMLAPSAAQLHEIARTLGGEQA